MEDQVTKILNQPVVIDNGSGTIKAGFAGEERPKCYSSSIVGRPKYSRVMAGALEGDTFIGNSAQENRGLLKLRYPIDNGIVQDWDDMELIWNHVYTKELKIKTEDHPFLLTEAPLNPVANRDRMAQIFFENFNIPAMYVSVQAILALYASGRTTGVVLDSGDGVSHVVPVYEGFSIPSSIKRIDIAGREVTKQLQLLLRKNGVPLLSSSEMELVRLIKEKHCFASLDPKSDENDWHSYTMTNPILSSTLATTSSSAVFTSCNRPIRDVFKLPDGKLIELGPERFRASEVLFHPEIIGSESQGIHEILLDSISKTDLDLRPSLYQSIVLSGGTTTTKGFGDRLLKELKDEIAKGTKLKIYAPPERKMSTWIGGSILAGLSTFKKMWVSRAEYFENPDIVHTKCL
ncbi:unnamed protein product [Kuraishia capsulata CBS 1993]|uniref:Actin-2 n=1 Tax=Kuraishia capsulata CBS 1993 TaxID=1382522 RepID=W6MH92_9ASCO|nr:uncharacterized protein KUCA_T00001295001 [Kuraishia capsulata CBS 1993]CDK25326.1 unnamed protein product [Kuraishia capsulata CBS 1993]